MAAGYTVDTTWSEQPREPTFEVTQLAAGALIQSTAPTTPGPPQDFGGDARAIRTLAEQEHYVDVADVQSLTKAVAVGERLASEARAVRSALADGAPAASLFRGERFVMPTAARFTSGFGARWGVTHYGIDLANEIGTPIYAVTDGVVVESGPASGFGLWVRVRHPGGWTSVYGHLNRALVREGERVRAGEQIAEMGNRGQSTGSHLHLEIWDGDGRKVNPVPWLSARGIDVTSATRDLR